MPDREDKANQEWEFVMEGITTRMQMALEKMGEANRKMSDAASDSNRTTRCVCVAFILALFFVVCGYARLNQMWIAHVENLKAGGVVSASETVSQLGQGAHD